MNPEALKFIKNEDLITSTEKLNSLRSYLEGLDREQIVHIIKLSIYFIEKNKDQFEEDINELKNINLIKDDILQKEFKEDYEQREIIRQAVMVCVKEEMFDGNVFNENSYKSGPGRGETYSSLIKKELFTDDLKNSITLIEEIIDKLISRC